jgi:hypothetical protein
LGTVRATWKRFLTLNRRLWTEAAPAWKAPAGWLFPLQIFNTLATVAFIESCFGRGHSHLKFLLLGLLVAFQVYGFWRLKREELEKVLQGYFDQGASS